MTQKVLENRAENRDPPRRCRPPPVSPLLLRHDLHVFPSPLYSSLLFIETKNIPGLLFVYFFCLRDYAGPLNVSLLRVCQ